MAATLNREAYAPDALVSLKVPVGLPYYTNSVQYEHVNGTVTIDGVIYQYVKRRIYADSIEYLCLRDMAQTRLQGAREQFFQLAYDLQWNHAAKGHHPSPVKPLMLEYCGPDTWALTPPVPLLHNDPFTVKTLLFPKPAKTPATQPPECATVPELC